MYLIYCGFFLGEHLQNMSFFHVIFSFVVQTFLLEIQKVKGAVKAACFFRKREAKKSQATGRLTAEFCHASIVLFYDPVCVGSLGFEYQRLHTYDSFTDPSNLKYTYLENVPSVPIRNCKRGVESWD